MTENEQTDKTNTVGDDTDSKPAVAEADKPVSIVEEARAIRDEIKKEREKLDEANKTSQKIQAENLLGGSAGGHVEAVKVSPEVQKAKDAATFFKGTQLEEDIKKANEQS